MPLTITSRKLLACALVISFVAVPCANARNAPAYDDDPMPYRTDYRTEELDQMLAPIALYPDALLMQVLMASAYPLEVVQAARWVRQHPNLSGTRLEDALQDQPWDPSVKSLTAFPQVLAQMDQNLDWTQKLGDAFVGQREQVMDRVQSLRRAAYAAGTLRTTAQQRVIAQPQYIVIEPASPQVVYVPVYQPTVVYGTWSAPAYPPVYFSPPPGAVFRSGFFWGLGVAMGQALWSRCDWRHRTVYVVAPRYRHFHRAPPPPGPWTHDPRRRYHAYTYAHRHGGKPPAITRALPKPNYPRRDVAAPPAPQPRRYSRTPGPDLRANRPDIRPDRGTTAGARRAIEQPRITSAPSWTPPKQPGANRGTVQAVRAPRPAPVTARAPLRPVVSPQATNRNSPAVRSVEARVKSTRSAVVPASPEKQARANFSWGK